MLSAYIPFVIPTLPRAQRRPAARKAQCSTFGNERIFQFFSDANFGLLCSVPVTDCSDKAMGTQLEV